MSIEDIDGTEFVLTVIRGSFCGYATDIPKAANMKTIVNLAFLP